jgi:hypothetical protein
MVAPWAIGRCHSLRDSLRRGEPQRAILVKRFGRNESARFRKAICTAGRTRSDAVLRSASGLAPYSCTGRVLLLFRERDPNPANILAMSNV